MLLTDDLIQQAIKLYGKPRLIKSEITFKEWEWSYLGPSISKNRFHDITLFIQYNKEKFVTIQKPYYSILGDTSNIFRVPSGGLRSSENITQAALREALEETGLTIRLIRFVLLCQTNIIVENRGVFPWKTIIFTAKPVSGSLGAFDKEEISNVAVHTREELQGPIRTALLNSGWGGFQYRVFLTDKTFDIVFQNK